jgi:hypothetical protein
MALAHPTSRFALAFAILMVVLSVFCGAASAASSKGEIRALFRPPTSADAFAGCSTDETQHFREQTTDSTGSRALKICEREASLPETLETSDVVSHIIVRGRTATVHLGQFENNLDGQILKIRLIKVGGRWKADEILGFFHLDRDKLIEIFKEEFSRPGERVPAKYAACIYSGVRHASAEEVTEFLFSGSSKAIVTKLYDPCLSSHS